MSANLEFQPVKEWHSLRGFANLFRKENRAWWGTRRWWMNALLWSGGLGGLVSMMLFILPSMAEATGVTRMLPRRAARWRLASKWDAPFSLNSAQWPLQLASSSSARI
jgi:hypothetical protein